MTPSTEFLLRMIDSYAVAKPERRKQMRDELALLLEDPHSHLKALEQALDIHPDREVLLASVNLMRAVLKRHRR